MVQYISGKSRIQILLTIDESDPKIIELILNDIRDLSIIGASKIAKGLLDYVEWSKKMIEEYEGILGENARRRAIINKNLYYIWLRANEIIEAGRTVIKYEGYELPFAIDDPKSLPISRTTAGEQKQPTEIISDKPEGVIEFGDNDDYSDSFSKIGDWKKNVSTHILGWGLGAFGLYCLMVWIFIETQNIALFTYWFFGAFVAWVLYKTTKDIIQEKADAKAYGMLISKKNQLINQLAGQWAIKRNELKEYEKKLRQNEMAFDITVKEKTKGFPWLAEAWADYLALIDAKTEEHLRVKKNPAIKASETVRDIKQEKRLINKENRVLRYTLNYYESLFPWLSEFKEEGIDELIVDINSENTDSNDKNHDEALYWLSQAEYSNLSSMEKYQKALDRYKNSRSKPWQIGRDYERYVGYKYETEGYSVTYHGIIEGFSDMGRDLICKRGEETLIVQCKCWAKHKTIHEKHINQLFGTSIMYGIQNPKEKVTPIFVSSTSLSDEARLFAKALGVQVLENYKYDKDYPIIKCNISKKDGTKIYHLPFDQQYDASVISNKGEIYVRTVAEAEKLGFRRAYRWHPEK